MGRVKLIVSMRQVHQEMTISQRSMTCGSMLMLHMRAVLVYVQNTINMRILSSYIDGLEEPDSFCMNAHKWFLTNLDCSLLWVKILGKAEFLNPGGSVKDRVAAKIIEEALETGELVRGGVVIEGSAGSTAISLATVAPAYGCKCHVVIPDDVAVEKVPPGS